MSLFARRISSMKLSERVRSDLRTFAFLIANGSLAVDLLEEIDYRSALMENGTPLEIAFAIWGNVVEVDENGEITNGGAAERRAAQWIRHYCDPSYVVEPPFEKWEVELH